jgi:hypothetical protein
MHLYFDQTNQPTIPEVWKIEEHWYLNTFVSNQVCDRCETGIEVYSDRVIKEPANVFLKRYGLIPKRSIRSTAPFDRMLIVRNGCLMLEAGEDEALVVLKAGDICLMPCNREFGCYNILDTEPAEVVEIGLLKNRTEPCPEVRSFKGLQKRGDLVLLASEDGRDDSLRISTDIDIFACSLREGETAIHYGKGVRWVWVHVLAGEIECNGTRFAKGRAVMLKPLSLTALTGLSRGAKVLLFDLPEGSY